MGLMSWALNPLRASLFHQSLKGLHSARYDVKFWVTEVNDNYLPGLLWLLNKIMYGKGFRGGYFVRFFFFVFSPPTSLIDIEHCISLRFSISLFDICIYRKIITTIGLVNICYFSKRLCAIVKACLLDKPQWSLPLVFTSLDSSLSQWTGHCGTIVCDF